MFELDYNGRYLLRQIPNHRSAIIRAQTITINTEESSGVLLAYGISSRYYRDMESP